jgi:hypothetical protein
VKALRAWSAAALKVAAMTVPLGVTSHAGDVSQAGAANPEGVFRQHMIVKGENRDTAWYSIIDTEWPALKRAYEEWLDAANFKNVLSGRYENPSKVGCGD